MDKNGKNDDFKIHCFNGEPSYIRYFSDRFTDLKKSSFDTNWKYLDFQIGSEKLGPKVKKPKSLNQMLDFSKKLSKGFDQVRIDFYDIDGHPYFVEFTFTPNNGTNFFFPSKWDITFGSQWKLKLPKMNNKLGVIYTCITAHYDELYNHTYTNPDWDYVCFTDDLSIANENNSHWQLRPLQYTKLDNTKNQRWHKLHPHLLFPDYEYSLWVDSNLDIMSPAVFEDVYMAINNAHTISIAPHPERDCLYDEMQACLDQKKDTLENMNPQIDKYKKDGFPAHYGLFETNIMLRKHNLKQVKKVMNEWWYWVENYSKRDQLSLTYVLWKNRQRANSLSKKSYRSKTKIISFWPHLSEIRNYYQDLSLIIESQQEQIVIKNNEIEILKRSLETIQSAKV